MRVILDTNVLVSALLAMAEAGRADYLATGDKRDVLPQTRHGGTQIVTAKRLLELLKR